MHVIGICRFSYPALGGFQVDFPDMEAKLAYLYAPERMAERFRTFETLTLPALRAQTDPDFTLVVVVGDSLPAEHRARLDALLADLPQAVVSAYPPRKHRTVMRDAINAVRPFDGKRCLQFRMDDDDAVAIDFVERLRREALALRPFAKGRRFLALDFNRGFLAAPGPGGLQVAETTTPYQTAALAILFGPRERLTVMNFTHNKLAERMTTVTFTDEDMFVRGHTVWNDSRQSARTKAPAMRSLDPDEEAYFRTRFAIDADAVRAAWSAA